ncbi:cobalamin B12-binding domain-containing protein [Tateyamaria pelophila]|uniref:cobalamin B12-binding domain-containing protein n=1 Tax=Tateyamaria pelophila TaxID=328415 RepID=UPI001CBEDDA0|nr:cobalamin B12-binding domain-containing protein [Tateyamaria pelophila]
MTHDDTFGQFGSGKKDQDSGPLASQVLKFLSERQNVGATGARSVVLDYLVRATLSPKWFDPVQVMHELRGYRLTVDTVIDLYIPQTAVCLGELWVTSDIDFAEVTVGSLRLQSLLIEASVDATCRSAANAAEVLSALVVVPEGEQHFLGATVAGGQLRRLGCDASVAFCESSKEIEERIKFDQPDMVLFSCARGAPLEYVARTVDKVRALATAPPVLALGGPIKGDLGGIKEYTDVDLVTNFVKDVVSFCAKRQKALGGR